VFGEKIIRDMHGPLGYLCVTFVAYWGPKTAVVIQKKIFVPLCDDRSKTKEMDNRPVQIGLKFVAR
jgi:hypothetical protein